ncbi:hypothetical protein TH61_16260 [Rufibacter sp. DG15C]|uniref:toxin-antitoxin system YwqK family antitoxin n=1 Tax=Rufibacter sp. DG15C TaxID=1379909 RepID=UPI00078D1FC5|nr:hypothetical protein [Rufibacter sp. DG15C]AMM52430.1 hypothetical protein TH61_16260 [Rufibacter sp. DG15C]
MQTIKVFTSLLLLLFVLTNLQAQTPPVRTWYFNTHGAKTSVKERWSENKAGIRHGKYIEYQDGGNVIQEGNYVNGVRNGFWKEKGTNVDGVRLYMEGNYVNGQKVGRWNNVEIDFDDKISNDFCNESFSDMAKHNVASIKKGYHVIIKDDRVVAAFDDKGVNLFEEWKIMQKQTDRILKEEQLERERIESVLKELSSVVVTIEV